MKLYSLPTALFVWHMVRCGKTMPSQGNGLFAQARTPLPVNCCGTVAIGYIKAALLYGERSWK